MELTRVITICAITILTMFNFSFADINDIVISCSEEKQYHGDCWFSNCHEGEHMLK